MAEAVVSPPPPRHVAVIMDGNGRWAKKRGLPRSAGHKKGADSVRVLLESAKDAGVEYITLFSFSSENWRRPEEEVGYLMRLMRYYLDSEIDRLHANGVRVRFIGDRSRLDREFVTLIETAEARTRDNTGQALIIALDYGSRREIVHAARRLAEEARAGRLDPEAIDEALFARHLFTDGIPDPDLIIRTSGEQRISNFLLWQSAYAELVFIDTLWPDFSKRDLEAAIDEYNRRERRFGSTGASR
jgi:undecaprenyl diphosphate synthase